MNDVKEEEKQLNVNKQEFLQLHKKLKRDKEQL